jgi:hypothetical protein
MLCSVDHQRDADGDSENKENLPSDAEVFVVKAPSTIVVTVTGLRT